MENGQLKYSRNVKEPTAATFSSAMELKLFKKCRYTNAGKLP
jgi:hypothetical protein